MIYENADLDHKFPFGSGVWNTAVNNPFNRSSTSIIKVDNDQLLLAGQVDRATLNVPLTCHHSRARERPTRDIYAYTTDRGTPSVAVDAG
jgi:hypothetical protein